MKFLLAISAIVFGSLVLGGITYWGLFIAKIAKMWRGNKRDVTDGIYD